MAVVIRLQGLRITAGSEDIRTFFTGLKIPDGGVHIIGGERQEAFVIFASDEDARRAMTRSGGSIRGSPVNLLLSSRSEMHSILEESTKQPVETKKRPYKEDFKTHERDRVIGETQRKGYVEMGSRSGSHSSTFSEVRKPYQQPSSQDGLYLLLKGLPFTATEENVRSFFDGLAVVDMVLMKNYRGQQNGKGIVKFKTRTDATEGLKRDRNYMGTRYLEVYQSSEETWLEVVNSMKPGEQRVDRFRRGPSPPYVPRYPTNRARSRSPVACRSTMSSPQKEEFCVLVENLPYSIQKKDIKEFFHPAPLKTDQILHLHDQYGKKTRCMFVLFENLRDYCAALTRHKQEFLNRYVHVSPISKEKMVAMLESSENPRDFKSPPERSRSRSQERLPRETVDSYESEKICLYVRNLPFDVRKVEIVDFFLGFRISDESIILLRDQVGNGLGEALVMFQSEEEAMRAQSLNGQGFLGANVILKCISVAQMREFGVEEPEVTEPRMTARQRISDGHLARNSEADSHLYTNYTGTPEMGNLPMNDLQVYIQGGSGVGLDPNIMESPGVLDRDNGYGHGDRGSFTPRQFEGPTCVKLVNLPVSIQIDEIYDFCYGYRVIPGSVSLQYNTKGFPKGCATVVFESRQEALTAVAELNKRPIGNRKVKLAVVY
ncbi:hypothetical protein UPYG_G00157450 [Umbra pygmaea]|uniref:RRM domain-containing protein n=1 Tax=Umbra pygmaea TaxID=75934 RepID=A0ABD0WYZ5_UMBPY